MSKLELIAVGLVVLVGVFLRFYNLPDTLLFLGDQGRDAIIAKNILKDGDIALIGPVTSVGNMYLGPFYYYFMVPFLAITYPSPVGPAYGVALINSLAIVGLYLIAKKLFDSPTAMIAAGLFAIMPVAVQLSRFSWNPNIAAPVAVLIYWFLTSWIQRKRWRDVIGLGITLGVIAQLHYVALVTWILVGINWLFQLYRASETRKKVFMQGIMIYLVAIAMMSPLIAFDFRHDHMISQKFAAFLVPKTESIQPKNRQASVIEESEGRTYQLLAQMVTGSKQPTRDRLMAYIGLFLFAGLWISAKKNSLIRSIPTIIVFQWLILTVVGIAFYSSSIFPHYLSYCLPIVALFWAIIVIESLRRAKTIRVVGLLILIGVIFLAGQGLQKIQFNGVGTKRIEQAVEATLPQVESPYNLALIAENGDFQGMNYRYFFEVSGRPPLSTDQYSGVKNLVVIDETQNNNPLSVAAFEIQAPNLTNLKTVIPIDDGPTVYVFK